MKAVPVRCFPSLRGVCCGVVGPFLDQPQLASFVVRCNDGLRGWQQAGATRHRLQLPLLAGYEQLRVKARSPPKGSL
jgi:hypothetical protein